MGIKELGPKDWMEQKQNRQKTNNLINSVKFDLEHKIEHEIEDLISKFNSNHKIEHEIEHEIEDLISKFNLSTI